MSEQASITVGQKVSPFEADSTAGRFDLTALTQHLVLYFYPKDNTPGCTTQSMDFRDHCEAFLSAGALVVGVSRDSLKSHENFKKKYELPFALISDPNEALCNQFGVMKNKMMYGKAVRGIERSSFVISKDGTLLRDWRGVKIPG
ncbi:MAG: peroxiredoxin, partial [Betaproteobacteria bacterium]|nr:peroxiredoxin [Betaproteobacteria bacterium]